MFLKCSHRIIRRGNMVREQDDARRRAFSIWLRTGRLPPVRSASGVEFKFNPWHDPENGRFTFAGTGRYYGRGGDRAKDQVGRGHGVEYVDDPSQPPITSMGEADAWRASELARHGHKPQYREAIEARYLVYKSAFANERGATTANEPLPSQREAHAGPHHYRTREPSPVRQINRSGGAHVSQSPNASARSGIGGGDFFGGGGATGGWDAPASPGAYAGFRDADSVALDKRSSEPRRVGGAPVGSERWRKVERNGYLYEIDEQNRTRRISGEITLNPEQGRSPTVQRAAGGGDRRGTDHGGHYIARRFNGPTEAFNHFAQDANFNRRKYLKLENEWARETRAGRVVRVKIVPIYDRSSQRPSALNIWYWIDGIPKSDKLPNEPEGAESGKR
jgi:uncharacterized membrane protein YgcG